MTASRPDLVVRGGQVVTPYGIRSLDLAIAEGRVVRLAASVAESGVREVDATGQYILPGIIDAHVHFNEPGRTDWEGLTTGSAALAAGGGTAFFDMPLNSEPPVLDAEHFAAKRALAEQKSSVDFGLWGGLTPLNLDRLAELRDAGAIGLKAFMSESGIASFPRVDANTLRAGMKRAAQLGLLVAVHAEDDELAAHFTATEKAAGHHDAAAWLASRPVEVELAAIRTAIDLAGETGCALHIVHVSSPEGIELVTAARGNGVDVSAETCPHYLLLNDDDVARIGAAAKCAPPIRDEARRRGLWTGFRRDQIQTLGSDHSPAPGAMKTAPDYFAIWGGVAGCQHGFTLLFSETADTAPQDWPALVAATSEHVARRFRLPQTKGSLREGNDADFSLVRVSAPREISADELLTRHRLSPYVGRKTRVNVTATFVRGETAYRAEGPTARPAQGRFLRPVTG